MQCVLNHVQETTPYWNVIRYLIEKIGGVNNIEMSKIFISIRPVFKPTVFRIKAHFVFKRVTVL
uniref:Uncharacterized protein n=1 Tax=Papilio xuthus TaxID=66420 RepID=I4DQP7_PAPXU|nr:unknown unsecreted protein [Papilio xuthus]